MKYNQYEFSASVWLYPGMAAWHFISVPDDISVELEENFGHKKRGWGSLRVVVTVGATTWKTSIFPDKKTKSYLLPLKAEVRKMENISEGDTIKVLLEIVTS